MISEADAKSPVAEMMVTMSQILTGKAEVRSKKKSAFNLLKSLKLKK